MTPEQLQTRLDAFAVAVHGLASPLLDRPAGQNAGQQIIKSSSSMAQNYAATCVSRSHREFTAKIGLVLEESTETLKWLHYIENTRLATPAQTGDLIQEAGELTAILKASWRTAEARDKNRPPKPRRPRRDKGR
ncbi:MAG TPA: four helix bundle protein [Vicinamibacterales bacterium]|nr:four helix bundle protein [Vicinamibacterales bacterium]